METKHKVLVGHILLIIALVAILRNCSIDSEMLKVKQGQIDVQYVITKGGVGYSYVARGVSCCGGWFFGETWHLLIDRDTTDMRQYKLPNGTMYWCKLVLYVDELTLGSGQHSTTLTAGSKLRVTQGWVRLSDGQAFDLSGTLVVVGKQERTKAEQRTDAYFHRNTFILVVVLGILLPFVFLIVFLSDLAEQAAKDNEQRKREEEAQRVDQQRRDTITQHYRDIRQRIIELSGTYRLNERSILRQLEQEFDSIRVHGFAGVYRMDHFKNRGWQLLLDLADDSGVNVCRNCETINPNACRNGHCRDCYHANDGGSCLKCAQNAGKDVCEYCRTINPRRCSSCGSCGCSVTIHGIDCSSCYD